MLKFKRAADLSKSAIQIFIPVVDGKIVAPKIERLFKLNLADELTFFVTKDKPMKAGELYEIPVSATGYKCER